MSNHQSPPNPTMNQMNQLIDVYGDDGIEDNNYNYNENMNRLFDEDGDDSIEDNNNIINNYNENMNNEYINRATAPNVATTMTITADGPNVTNSASAPHTLADGRVIDCKNTLWSFAVSDSRIAIAAAELRNVYNRAIAATDAALAPFTLFDGRLIDCKNTLFSFAISDSRIVAVTAADPMNVTIREPAVRADPTGRIAAHDDNRTTTSTFNDVRIMQQTNIVHDYIEDILENLGTGSNTIISNSRNYNNAINNNVPIFHSQAVQVQSLAVVEGVLFDSGIKLSPPPPPPIQEPYQYLKLGVTFWLMNAFAMLLVGVGTGIGVYCGTGNCGSSSSTLSSRDTLTTPTTDIHPATPPLIAVTSTTTTNQQLQVACNFLGLTSLTECQATTEFFGTTTGTTIPTEIGVLTQLIYLDLDDQGLNGTIPSTLGNLIQLTGLSLSSNQWTGTIPSTLGNLIQLTWLDLWDNQLNGTIPSTMGNLNQLTWLNLWGNQLTGTIPSTLGNLTQLTLLGLDSNQLTGSIPSIFGDLTQLTWLGLESNQLTGTIPSTLGNLIQLTGLSLSSKQLIGTIPSTLGNLSQLTWLNLWGNQLNGTIPSTFGNLIQLTWLNLWGNQLTGTIPSTLGNLIQLTNLYLDNNAQLGGTIPSILCSVSSEIGIRIDCENIACSCCMSSYDVVHGFPACPLNSE